MQPLVGALVAAVKVATVPATYGCKNRVVAAIALVKGSFIILFRCAFRTVVTRYYYCRFFSKALVHNLHNLHRTCFATMFEM